MEETTSLHESFDQYNDITLQILRLANKGIPRERFKHQVAEILLSFSSCDVLEVFILQNDHQLFWRTERFGNGQTYFEKRETLAEIGKFYTSLINGRAEIPELCISSHGSFRAGDKKNIPSLLKQNPDYSAYSSLLMIPFEINGEKQGLLVFKSREEHFFSDDELNLYERLAFTLGIAISFC